MNKKLWIINLLSVLIILIFGTLLMDRYFLNIDLTQAKLYTLSDATKKIVKELKNRIIIKVFFSKDIPYPFNNNIKYVKEILKDYSKLSKGKILIDIIDPDDENFEIQVSTYGIPAVQVNAIENEQIQIKKVYMGLAFVYKDKIETIPVISDVSALEYEISSTIKSLLSEGKKSIGFITGHGENPLFGFKKVLRKHYEVRNVNISEDDLVDMDLVILAGPKREFSKDELFKIDQFIIKGGKVFFMIDRVGANLQYGFGSIISTGIEELLKNYGIEIEDSLVYDLSSGMINISERRGGMIFTTVARYPFFPRIINLNKEHIITKDLESITFGFTSPIHYKNKEKITIIPLAKTTEKSGILKAPFYVGIDRRFQMSDFSGPSQVVAVVVSGRFVTKFPEKKEALKEGESRIVVVSDSEFATDNFLSLANKQFVMNIIDWLTEDDSLISIRSKRVESRPIKEISSIKIKKVLKYGTIIVPPMLTIFTGMLIWAIRKRKEV